MAGETTRVLVEVPHLIQAKITAVDSSGTPVPRLNLGFWAWGSAGEVDTEGIEQEPAFQSYIDYKRVRTMLRQRGVHQTLRMRDSTAFLPVLSGREVVIVLIGSEWQSSMVTHAFTGSEPELRMSLRPR